MASELREGEIFAGRYRVVTRIASGGMGTVYEVIHLDTQRHRALKIMHAHIVQSRDLGGSAGEPAHVPMSERFQREARVTAGIESEFIVDVFDAGVEAERPYLVMELLRGEEIGKRLRRLGRFAPLEVITYLSQVAVALDKTHAAFIVHRDLKPENLFLTLRDDGTPRIKILDFGVAKLVAEGTTRAGATSSVGTPLYMAPEQFRMDVPVAPASDLYALGMIAHTFLVGQPYWAEEARRGANVFAFAALAATGAKEPASARALRAGVRLPPAFDAWFAAATAVDPAKRFPSATTAVRALAAALEVASPPREAMTPALPPADIGPPVMPAQTEVILSSGDFVTSGSTTTNASTLGPSPEAPPAAASARVLVAAVIAGMSLGGFLLLLLWPSGAPPRDGSSAASSAPSATAEVSASASASATTRAEAPIPIPIPSASAPEPRPAASAPAPASASASASAPTASPKPLPPRPQKPAAPSRYSPD